MRLFLIPIAAAALAAGAVAFAGQTPAQDAKRATALAKLTAGMTPGKPVECLDTHWRDASVEAYGDKLVYKFGRKQLYVNDTGGGCSSIARGDTLVTRQYTGRLCHGDIARTVNIPSGMDTGGCVIGSFTPYTAN